MESCECLATRDLVRCPSTLFLLTLINQTVHCGKTYEKLSIRGYLSFGYGSKLIAGLHEKAPFMETVVVDGCQRNLCNYGARGDFIRPKLVCYKCTGKPVSPSIAAWKIWVPIVCITVWIIGTCLCVALRDKITNCIQNRFRGVRSRMGVRYVVGQGVQLPGAVPPIQALPILLPPAAFQA